MKNTKEFPFERARRITAKETTLASDAIQPITHKLRPVRGRPAKESADKYCAISIRLHPKIIIWAKRLARKTGKGYQTIINNVLIKLISKEVA